jgi:carbon-monoxide dehydrogenase catalytic subunit
VLTHFGTPFPVVGSPGMHQFLTEELEEMVGGKFLFEPDPLEAAKSIIEHIDKKRAELKLQPVMYAADQSLRGAVEAAESLVTS